MELIITFENVEDGYLISLNFKVEDRERNKKLLIKLTILILTKLKMLIIFRVTIEYNLKAHTESINRVVDRLNLH